jgi:hypothetical protein
MDNLLAEGKAKTTFPTIVIHRNHPQHTELTSFDSFSKRTEIMSAPTPSKPGEGFRPSTSGRQSSMFAGFRLILFVNFGIPVRGH